MTILTRGAGAPWDVPGGSGLSPGPRYSRSAKGDFGWAEKPVGSESRWQPLMSVLLLEAARRQAWGEDLDCCRPEDLVECLWHYYEAAIEAVDDRSAAELAFNDCKRIMPSSWAFAALFEACSRKLAPTDLLVVACREAARVSGRKPEEVLGRACVDIAREVGRSGFRLRAP